MRKLSLIMVKEKSWAGIELVCQTRVLKFTVLKANFHLRTHVNWQYFHPICLLSTPLRSEILWCNGRKGQWSDFWFLFVSELPCDVGQIDSCLHLCFLICKMGWWYCSASPAELSWEKRCMEISQSHSLGFVTHKLCDFGATIKSLTPSRFLFILWGGHMRSQ